MSWQSPVAKQYGLSGIPHFKLYDENGRLLKEGFEVYKDILSWSRRRGR